MDLQESMLLWIPVSRECPEESDDLIQQVMTANGAVLDFCEGYLSLDETLQIVSDCNADVDDYIENLAQTISWFGA